MRISVYNDGDNPIRVIADHDTVNDQTLESGEERIFESPPEGVIEFRELGGAPGDMPGGVEHA